MAQIKVKATLPSGEVKSLSFPQRATVEQVKVRLVLATSHALTTVQ